MHEVDDHLGALSRTSMDGSRIVSSANSGVSETTDLEVFLQLSQYTWVKFVTVLRSCICARSVCVRLHSLHRRGYICADWHETMATKFPFGSLISE